MKFAQLHYFLSQNIGGTKYIISHSVQKLWGTFSPRPPINSVPANGHIFYGKHMILPNALFLSNIIGQQVKIFFEKINCFFLKLLYYINLPTVYRGINIWPLFPPWQRLWPESYQVLLGQQDNAQPIVLL